MENILFGDDFYSELGDLLEDIEIETIEEASALEDDYAIGVHECNLEPIVTITPDWLAERVGDDRWPEDNDRIAEQFTKALNESIDFEKLNKLMPKLYYPVRKKTIITKQDIIKYLTN